MITKLFPRFSAAVVTFLAAGTFSGCTTTYYDAYGYPRQAVDPGVALAGVAAAGVLGYALADSHDHHYRDYHPRYRHYSRHYHYRGRSRDYCW